MYHREGGANFGGMYAPMAFTDYRNLRSWAKAIALSVSNGTMPPWHAAPAHAGEFTIHSVKYLPIEFNNLSERLHISNLSNRM